MDKSERAKRLQRIREIRAELQELHRLTQPTMTARAWVLYAVSGGLTVIGVVLSIPTGGTSLALSIAGGFIAMIQTGTQIQSAAESIEAERRAAILEQELQDHVDFLERFGWS